MLRTALGIDTGGTVRYLILARPIVSLVFLLGRGLKKEFQKYMHFNSIKE